MVELNLHRWEFTSTSRLEHYLHQLDVMTLYMSNMHKVLEGERGARYLISLAGMADK